MKDQWANTLEKSGPKTKFKGYTSKASEDHFAPISRDVYRRLYSEGTHHTIQTSVKLRDFAELYLR